MKQIKMAFDTMDYYILNSGVFYPITVGDKDGFAVVGDDGCVKTFMDAGCEIVRKIREVRVRRIINRK